MPIIGIVGGVSPLRAATLALEIAKVGALEKGYSADQEFPSIVNFCSLFPRNDQYEPLIASTIRLLEDIGADIIVIPSGYSDAYLESRFNAKDVKAKLITGDKKRDICRKIYEQIDQIKDNKKSFSEKIAPRLFQSFIKNAGTSVVGIVGAGVVASCDLSIKLAETNVPHIHLCDSYAPGKNDYFMYGGESFVPDYQRDIRILQQLGCSKIAIPCNTAHINKDEYIDKESLIDIREATLKNAFSRFKPVNHGTFILLATEASIDKRLYDGIEKDGFKTVCVSASRVKIHPSNSNTVFLVTPSKDQLKQLMLAIYNIKKFDCTSSREIIDRIIAEIRQAIGDESTPVILGCTELNKPYSLAELSEKKFISSTDALASECQEQALAAQNTKHYPPLNNNNDYPSYVSADGFLSEKIFSSLITKAVKKAVKETMQAQSFGGPESSDGESESSDIEQNVNFKEISFSIEKGKNSRSKNESVLRVRLAAADIIEPSLKRTILVELAHKFGTSLIRSHTRDGWLTVRDESAAHEVINTVFSSDKVQWKSPNVSRFPSS